MIYIKRISITIKRVSQRILFAWDWVASLRQFRILVLILEKTGTFLSEYIFFLIRFFLNILMIPFMDSISWKAKYSGYEDWNVPDDNPPQHIWIAFSFRLRHLIYSIY